ncbi:Crp/Fnr family transcriptional regulator [Mucilaginibacter sp. AW1-7]|jgi:CRP-like cAMP-binding protein|uniref:Crp/Fnr family transcriptional regulator n=1 Tax=unclassified Mucilaginibacter TaxID=2617802 RepID=UPI0008C9E48D|nr:MULTISPECIES: Crp/Fnr family transcriptional regulator [unclassified Mucilaginibacter]WDF78137.1 Crp/Fnr family transcriptional regulator [Mucilaginibacter sp. KACC 22773]SEO05518.1 cAMP-binding domain of CRP or a regulatory subunit of cAMP-dependent protein kinases [Mucilaginibacter sp. OK283]
MKHDLPYWYEPLKKKYPVVTDAEWALLNRIASVKHIRKGDPFLKYGKVARYSAFVISGLFKFSIQDEESDEKIIRFGFPTDFLANCESYNKKAPSAVSITALEDAVILKLNIKKLQPLYDLHMNLLHVNLDLYREISEQQSEHQHILSLKSPLGRYRYLLERRPVIIQKITLTNIARYLYVSREALSRARLLISK